ncbi:MAG: YifB family Mg chelatase-like AAA ATPase [Gammaproteobacteria bacterium]|nr:YifB family Mg chelatase-like AAA ATPase [Gammaproteobacteria bacterium]
MTLATILSRTQQGLEAPLVRVEVHVGNGLPAFSIVGLPETAVKESKDRVRAALANCGYDLPPGHITVNLAPADLPKEGGRFDLPIAIGILVASDQLPPGPFADTELYGELSLGGELHAIRGVLPTALQGTRAGHTLILPDGNLAEAALVRRGRIHGATHLLEVCRYARGMRPLPKAGSLQGIASAAAGPDLAEVRGQAQARRALEIAAAGEHSLLLIGPPGAGKSMLAQRLPGLLPPMTEEEALETAALRSLTTAGFRPDDWQRRPFRAPHHTASGVALVGGGARPRPGEISLAHNGVLFLDELPEFDRQVLEVLREPLESGHIVISRAARQSRFPARFQLIAAMNPCPCGHLGDRAVACRCTPERIEAYRSRISGPLLDRIDLHVEVPRVPPEALTATEPAEPSAAVARRVATARALQARRQGRSNSRVEGTDVLATCAADDAAMALLDRAMRRLALSARAYHRVLRVARSIADLAESERVRASHVAEAITLRQLDRRATSSALSSISA